MDNLFHDFYKKSYKVDKAINSLPDLRVASKHHLARYRETMAAASRFTLGDDAVEHIVIRGIEDHANLLERVPLANLPFEKVWLEYDNHARVRAQARMNTSEAPDQYTPHRAGFLIQRGFNRPSAWYVTKVFSSDLFYGLSPIAYIFDSEAANPIQQVGPYTTLALAGEYSGAGSVDIAEVQRAMANPLWGYAPNAYPQLLDDLNPYAAHSMEGLWRDYAAVSFKSGRGSMALNRDKFQKVITETILENTGDMRFLVTALAIINEVPVTYTTDTRRGTFLAGGKQQNFFSNTIIGLNIPAMKRKTVKQFLAKAAETLKRKRHQVRGYWRVSERKLNENWVEFINAKGDVRYRRWVDHHYRGDAALGWVHQEYEVTSR